MKKPILGTAVLIACLLYSSLAHAQPTVTTLNPQSGAIGTEVIVSGSSLLNATAVTFNGVSAVINLIDGSGQFLLAVVPPGATTGPVTVTTPGGSATSPGNFVVTNVPTVTTLNPQSGAIGTEVIVSGSSLLNATAVTFVEAISRTLVEPLMAWASNGGDQPQQLMALTVGSRLGHYDVTVLIGQGGMGQVYRATDTKLDRDVALKVLPHAFYRW